MAIGTTAAILGGAAISGAAGLAAANKQSGAAKSSNRIQQQMYNETVERMQPFYGAGQNALQAYLYELGLGDAPMIGAQPAEGGNPAVPGAPYGGISMTPASNFLLEQGRGTIEAGAAGRGGLFSGSALKGLERYRQNIALSDRENQLNRLFNLTQSGQNAAANLGNAGQNYATAAGNNLQAGANAAGAGYIAAGNAANDALGNYLAYQNYDSLLRRFPVQGTA